MLRGRTWDPNGQKSSRANAENGPRLSSGWEKKLCESVPQPIKNSKRTRKRAPTYAPGVTLHLDDERQP
jgi:hypothetical protein